MSSELCSSPTPKNRPPLGTLHKKEYYELAEIICISISQTLRHLRHGQQGSPDQASAVAQKTKSIFITRRPQLIEEITFDQEQTGPRLDLEFGKGERLHGQGVPDPIGQRFMLFVKAFLNRGYPTPAPLSRSDREGPQRGTA